VTRQRAAGVAGRDFRPRRGCGPTRTVRVDDGEASVEIDQRPFTDILVPLDGSAAAKRALTPALLLAVCTVVPVRVLRRADADEAAMAAGYLAGVADRYAGLIDVETEVVDLDSVPDAIVEGLGPGTLVCMSSHGRGRVAQAVMGGVAEALLRMIDRPALVVGPHLQPDVTFTGRVVAVPLPPRRGNRPPRLNATPSPPG